MSEEVQKICKVLQEYLLNLVNVSPSNARGEDLSGLCPFCSIMVAFHEKEANVSNFDTSIQDYLIMRYLIFLIICICCVRVKMS